MKLPWTPTSNAAGGAPCPYCGVICEVRVNTNDRAYTYCQKTRGGCGFECRWPPGAPEAVVVGFEPLDSHGASSEPAVSDSAPSKPNPSKPNPSKEPKTEKENADAVREDEGGGFLGLRW